MNTDKAKELIETYKQAIRNHEACDCSCSSKSVCKTQQRDIIRKIMSITRLVNKY